MKRVSVFARGLLSALVAFLACAEPIAPTPPATPVNVTATLISATSANVSWSPNPASDGVVSYNIVRNGAKVGESASASFTDAGLSEQTIYRYTVSATGVSGLQSPPSAESAGATVTTPDVTPPLVTSSSPAHGSAAVSTFTSLTVTFSEPMDAATINPTSFGLKLTNGGASIPGTVTYAGATRLAEFKPASQLPSTTSLTATVTTSAKDIAGNALAAPHIFSFTTLDETAPTVIATSPVNGATGVSATTQITVNFSEAMDAVTINAGTITLRATSSGTLVAGTVSYESVTHAAILTPSAPLSAEPLTYTVTVAPGVKDAAGNALGATVQFNFTTADVTRPVVVSTIPGNLATDVSPAVVVSATFSKPMNPATINSATFTLRLSGSGAFVPGTVGYNAGTSTASFTPSAPLGSVTGYTAAILTGTKDAVGNAIASSVVWTFITLDNVPPLVTSVLPANGATNVLITTAVILTFSEAMDPSTISGSTVVLRNATTSADVPAAVSYSPATSTAALVPSSPLSFSTDYTIVVSGGATDLARNGLSNAFASSFSTASAPDITPPTVVSTTPANGATDVPVTSAVSVTFSEAMDPSTISGATVVLRNATTSAHVPAIVSYNPATSTATLVPSSPLSFSTDYTIVVSGGATDLARNGLSNAFASSFSTASAPDITPPTVVSTTPANGATNVPVTSLVRVTFSEPMDPASINATTVALKVSADGTPVSGGVSYDPGSTSATFTPAAPLGAGVNYTLTVAGPTDVPGNALAGTFTTGFTTAAPGDVTRPTVVSTSPADGATNVPTTAVVRVTFSEKMDPATINATTFSLIKWSSGAGVTGTVTLDATSNTATLTPAEPLSQNATYVATVTTGAKDLAGNSLSANVLFAFTVEAPAPSIVVVSVNPGQQFQTIQGWGVSMRMFTDPHIIGLPQNDPANALQISASAQAEILDSLYRGIGLTRVRVAPDPAGIEPVNDNGDPFNTDLSKFDFSGRNNDAFFGVTSDLRGRGMTHWWMSPIEIEPFMNESNPDEYVEWAMAINRRWRAAGLELPYYSIANEPTRLGNPLRSGTYMRDVVKLLGHKLRTEGFSTRIVVPDDISPSAATGIAQTVLADADARQFVGAIAYHLYGEPVTESAGLRGLSAQYGIPLWMSEYYVQDWMEWGTLVHSLLSDYDVTVVDYLAGFLGDESGGAALIGLLHAGTQYHGYRMQSQYYSFGNFTRYVRPGAVRVAASSPDDDLQISAFMRGGRLTLIGINHHDTDVTVRFNLGAASSNSFSSVRTSAGEHLVPLSPVAVSSGSIMVVLKAASITTLYQ